MLAGQRQGDTKDAGSDQPQPSTPTISLPKGGGAIRGIGEKFAANPVTGTGSMTVPIATSPGRSGFGPQLSLSYDSGAGNGPFGLGWSLSLPQITRKTDKGLPRYHDADESDVFILSGAEDLVPVLKTDGTIDDITRDGYTVRKYRPRIEGLFARIERWTSLFDPADVFWRSISKDNITTFYGKGTGSRIADPSDPSHIFSWLICQSYDDKGNAIVYEYSPENEQGIDLTQANERNRTRTANRYLKRIKYGNRMPNRDAQGQATDPSLLPAGTWMFEMVFDYGEGHLEASPFQPGDYQFATATLSLPNTNHWPARQDPFSSYRSGFEVRTYGLCRRVLMFHHFPTELGIADCLVRSTEFTYAEGPVASFITQVTQSGYVRQPSQAEPNRYLRKSLPPVEFTYSQVPTARELATRPIQDVDAASLENLPIGLDGSAYQWVDLDGDGLAGLLADQGDGWFYKRNVSPLPPTGETEVKARFAPVEFVSPQPAGGLRGGQAQFMDLAGDGQPDLVLMDGPVRGFFERTPDDDWEAFRPFTSWPNVDTRDPNLKFIDLNGDGHSDILITEHDAFTWYPSLAEEGFGAAQRTFQPWDEEKAPRLVFADGAQSIYLADLSGDGLTDLVRIRNGEVCYWPNLGYGRFGAKVTMDNPPWFDAPDLFDQKRIRLADIDGSGVTDILYLGANGVQIYFNHSGNSWSDGQTLTNFPMIDNLSSVQAVDLLGNGTACLVWSSPLPGDARQPMRYLDLMGQKPHLLVKTVNNLGAETVVQYAPSTKFYLQDTFDGKPWITRLPFPVHVVERVETYDRVSENRFVSRYAYHHGFFDGGDREFRGFGMVEQWDTEEIGSVPDDQTSSAATNLDDTSFVPPIHTKTWFHTGVYSEGQEISRHLAAEYYGASDEGDTANFEAFLETLLDDTVLPPDLTLDEEREACRALKGTMLRQEVYADDEPEGASEAIIERAKTPYTVTEQNFTIERLQPLGPNRHAVVFTHAREALSYHYERNPDDPRIGHTITLEVDQYGNVLKSVSIGYGRPPGLSPLQDVDKAKQEQLLITYTESDYTENDMTNPAHWVDAHRTPLPCEARTYELTGFALATGAVRFAFDDFAKDDFTALTSLTPILYETPVAPAVKGKRLIEHMRTLYRRNDLTSPLPLGQLQSLALTFESYKLAFSPGLLTEGYGGRVTTAMLATEGGYVHSEGDANWWIPSGHIFFSTMANPANPAATAADEATEAWQHFFLPRKFTDPFGHSGTVDYDGVHNLLVVKTEDAVQNTVTALHDYRVLQPRQMTDPNGNRSEVAFDALGMAVATAVMGKVGQNLGDLLEDFTADPALATLQSFIADPQAQTPSLLGKATTRIVYDLDRFHRCAQPPFAATLARETHFFDPGGAQTKIQISFSYSDGFGREIQKKIQAESGDAPQRQASVPLPTGDMRPGDLILDANGKLVQANAPRRWVGNGRTVFNNKGKPVKQYEPFFSATHLYEEEGEMTDTGVSPLLFYDPAERVVATLHPNHTWEKVVFDPWQQTTYDVNDTVLNADGSTDPKSDEDVTGFFSRLPEADYLPTWYEQRIALAANDPERIAAEKAAVHRQTPTVAHLDTLGRTFLTLTHDRFERSGAIVEEKYPTRVELDIEGNQRVVRDAVVQNGDVLGRIVMGYYYDMLGSRIHQTSMEAGERWTLNDVTGKPIGSWDSRGFTRRMTYDELRRPTALFVTEGGVKRLAERTVYGESQGATNNHRTRVFQVFDAAGMVTSEAYDFKGNLSRGRRELLPDYKGQVDWQQDPTPNDGTFSSTTTFDALNRSTAVTTPDNSTYRPTYNEANLLDKVEVNLRGAATATPFVTNIDYNAKGQRTLIHYANGAETTCEYDDQTFRLTHLKTTRAPGPNGPLSQIFNSAATVQDLRYTYDPSGNITGIADEALPVIVHDNQTVAPVCDYTYDAIYRLIEATGREHIGQTVHDFNPQNRRDYDFSGLTDFIANPNDLQAMRRYTEIYEYDAVGNFDFIHHVANGGGWTRSYEYGQDSLTEPQTATQPAKKSNRLTKTTVGNGLTFSETYTYTDAQGKDVHGCMTSMNAMQMEWDFKDQLQKVDLGGGGTAFYVYDAAGQRVRKVIETQNGTLSEERLYLTGFEIYRKFDTNALERETLHVMDDKQRIALVETKTHESGSHISNPQSLIRFQLGNHLGSASLELDKDGGLISYEEYHPYGTTAFQAMNSAAEVSLKRYRYTGKERDEETGLYYHGARYYAPWLAKWISADPTGLRGGSHLFQFSIDNPVTYKDPNGCEPTASDVNQKRFKEVLDLHKPDAGQSLIEAFTDTGFKEHRTWYQPGISDSELRLQTILEVTKSKSTQFGGGVVGTGDAGFRREFRDSIQYHQDKQGKDVPFHLGSSNQIGHFLTAAGFGYQAQKLFLGGAVIESASLRNTLVRAMVGHELVADDTKAHYWRMSDKASAHLKQTAAASREQVGFFLSDQLDKIRLDTNQEGNSYQDLYLSRVGFVFGEKVASGFFKSREEAAEWLKMTLTPVHLDSIQSTHKFYQDAQWLKGLLKQFQTTQQNPGAVPQPSGAETPK